MSQFLMKEVHTCGELLFKWITSKETCLLQSVFHNYRWLCRPWSSELYVKVKCIFDLLRCWTWMLYLEGSNPVVTVLFQIIILKKLRWRTLPISTFVYYSNLSQCLNSDDTNQTIVVLCILISNACVHLCQCSKREVSPKNNLFKS